MRFALLGCGVVGGGVAKIVDEKVPSLELVRILTLPGEIDDPRQTSDIGDIVNDDTVEAVVEAMGGLEPAHTFILQCLNAGKSVVTSNKAVVAAFLPEFAAAAEASGAGLFIEATSGGGVPWIASIVKARRIDALSEVYGILNGTSNYLIHSMETLGTEFDTALAEAQSLGYAERDPSADIDGIDTANKCVISATVAFGSLCRRDIPVHGIRNLTAADIAFFRSSLGRAPRLMARAIQRDGAYAACVEPVLLPVGSVEANVPANYNLATLVGDTVGTLKFYGQGAGSLPTGNAIVQDLLDCAGGERPAYATETTLQWDPALLAGDYVFRSSVEVPGAQPMGEGPDGQTYWLLHDADCEAAGAAADALLAADPAALMAALGTTA
ncbi:homoserine dehydrogenase [Olsenella sp. YH-ols2217]|uniref:Homoserine dehydrogenase n=1 Tax=Kribbibacterium absianum TaxID=3044210 RepID=A0ABT6ZLX4_9ACTN|nr:MULTISPECIES: homoserine dehydrogenase [unclassified Olsenella]MDJ1122046.1 homoserine dehydrogenase [Olsenella sp. YH-ols2216]MDJ1130054.1 homoserine dehydrogenase [Olsenella sp. YH-ols2217]